MCVCGFFFGLNENVSFMRHCLAIKIIKIDLIEWKMARAVCYYCATVWRRSVFPLVCDNWLHILMNSFEAA